MRDGASRAQECANIFIVCTASSILRRSQSREQRACSGLKTQVPDTSSPCPGMPAKRQHRHGLLVVWNPQLRALRNVMSTANCTPPWHGNPWARTSMFLESWTGTSTSQRNAKDTRPCLAKDTCCHALGGCGSSLHPATPHEIRWWPNMSRGAWHPSHVASVIWSGNRSLSSSNLVATPLAPFWSSSQLGFQWKPSRSDRSAHS